MKKLTREEIQALLDYELNFYLIYYRYKDIFDSICKEEITLAFIDKMVFKRRTKKIKYEEYHCYLDAQFELAEKFGILYSVVYSPNPVEDLGSFDKFLFGVAVNFDEHTKRKRTGAELLLEAIQELEEVK